MKLTETHKNLLTLIKSELIQQDVDSGELDPMNIIQMGEALSEADNTISNYLNEEE